MAGSATVEKRLDFGLLGPLQMTIDGTPVPSGTPKQRAVLAMLVINRNRPVGVDALITALWEEWPPSGARASIHSYVSNLRKLLGGAGIDPRVVLAAAPPGYRLSIPDNTCDLGRFVAEKTAGVHAAAAGRFEQASRHLSAALREWRGPRKTNPWPLVAGAAAVVLVLVLGAIGIWIAIRPKPVQPPQPVAEERLSALLLNSSEVNAVMGSSSMQPGKPITSMDSSPVTVSLPDCQGALYTSQDPVYAGTGYTAINGLISSEPGDNYEHWVNQAVVAFPTADKARAFVQTSADKWKNCAGKTVTVTNKAKTYRWTFADVKGSPPTITVIDTQEGAEGWECQRAMSVANNVVVDVNACGYQITNQAGQIAAKIVDKVNKE